VQHSEKETALAAVRAACTLTRSVQEEIAAAGQRVLKDDRSPVTVADLAAQAVVIAHLRDAFPGDPIMAEEDAAPFDAPDGGRIEARVRELASSVLGPVGRERLHALLESGTHPGGPHGRFWVLDPVDGTKGFLRGEQYAVALALIEDGRVVLGAVGCPNLPVRPGAADAPRGCVFLAERGRGTFQYTLDGGPPVPVRVDSVVRPQQGSFCESVEAAHSSHGTTARVASRLGITAPPYRVDGQTKYAIVARGEASIYLRLPTRPDYREKVWDHAAGSLIVTEAGGRVSHVDGREPDFSSGRTLPDASGIVVTSGAIHGAVLEAVRREIGARTDYTGPTMSRKRENGR